MDSSEYLDDPEASAKVFRDGFFYPGDLAVRRGDGRIRVLGRIADVLTVGGNKIPVAPIERAVEEALRVDAVCIFGGLDDEGREKIVVAIETKRDPTAAEQERVAAFLPPFERVQFVVFPEFPRAAAGMRKIQRRALRQLAFFRT
jgi:acyl-CoA synthetase (AMP-forming)/AMP-acid ligase II